ncbi:MAG: DUF2079 domain-containing protein [Anaerolineales bacterium]|nr:DUF2079 domain-containing protein [Anaerolineales bacterium]
MKRQIHALSQKNEGANQIVSQPLVMGQTHQWWTHRISILLAVLFSLGIYWMNSRKYLAFQVYGPDVAKFGQAAWNTLRGRFLYTSMYQESILSNHFSPFMAALSPLLLIWRDTRILYLYQIVGMAVAGYIISRIVSRDRPWLAVGLLLAFYLNPNLHTVAMHEFSRIALVMPFLALIAYAVYTEKHRLMLAGILLALLCREDNGLIVFALGIYFLIVKRDWKWGIPLAVSGAGWTFVMLKWVIPLFLEDYHTELHYFAAWGDSWGEMLVNMLRNPLLVLQTMFDSGSLTAIWQALIPVAIITPFIGFDYLFLCLPMTAIMLISSEPDMHVLGRWYMAPILPFFFAAVAVALNRLSIKRARIMMLLVLAGTIFGFLLFSPVPPGKKYEPYRYQLTERTQKTWELLEEIPPEASVAAQVSFVVQLSNRDQAYIYPWTRGQEIAYYVVGEEYNSYPVPAPDMHWEILKLVTDPGFTIVKQFDNVYLLHKNGPEQPSIPINRTAEESIQLEKADIALTGEDGFYRPASGQTIQAAPGQNVRVSLYWRALARPDAERTVSVRIAAADGFLIAQQDSMPAEGSRPTSWWEEGWYFRDVYYLTIPPGTTPGAYSLDLVLYDSYAQERVLFDAGADVLTLYRLVVNE